MIYECLPLANDVRSCCMSFYLGLFWSTEEVLLHVMFGGLPMMNMVTVPSHIFHFHLTFCSPLIGTSLLEVYLSLFRASLPLRGKTF